MKKNITLIKDLQKLLLKNDILVSDVEMVSGNYDESGNLIEGEIPIITTGLCEIGSYFDVCYFTIIIYSDSFNNYLFEELKNYKNIHIYGLKNFQEDYFPKVGFTFNKLTEQIKEEKYFQIQFNFEHLSHQEIFEQYLKVSESFKKLGIEVFNQVNSKPE